MRILIFSHGHPALSPGGAETASYALFQEMKRMDVEVLYVAAGLDRVAGTSRRKMFYQGRKDEILVSLPHLNSLSLCSLEPRSVREILEPIVQEFSPDIVHLHHFLGAGLQILPWLKATTKAVVLTLHEYLALCHNHGQFIKTSGPLCFYNSPMDCAQCFPEEGVPAFFSRERIIAKYFSFVDRFICPSHFLRDRFGNSGGWDMSRFAEIENVLTLSDLALPVRRPSAGQVRIGFFGRYTANKGIDLLLEALLLLPSADRALLSVGLHGGGLDQQPIDFQRKIRHLATQAGKTISDHGYYVNAQVRKLMSRYDWIVVPSIWWENSPVVIQEALATGIPVLCGDEGGMAEKVIDGKTGIHFAMGSAASLSEALRGIVHGTLQPPEISQSQALEASRRSVQQHFALYRELLINSAALTSASPTPG